MFNTFVRNLVYSNILNWTNFIKKFTLPKGIAYN